MPKGYYFSKRTFYLIEFKKNTYFALDQDV